MGEKSLDPQLWQACAGGMVNIPPVNSKVFYFPQGHAEHAQSHVDFPAAARIPALILCRVTSLRFMADPDTDEVFAKIRLVPLGTADLDPDDDAAISVPSAAGDVARESRLVRENPNSIGRQQRRRILRPPLLRGDDLPPARLRRGPSGPERHRQRRPRRRMEVPPHLPRDPETALTDHGLEQLREPEEARRRRLDSLPPLRIRRNLRRNSPRDARRQRRHRPRSVELELRRSGG